MISPIPICHHRGQDLLYCAGALAEIYERMGGTTIQAGKPNAPIYRLALSDVEKALARPLDLARVLAVGDAMKTDINGAVKWASTRFSSRAESIAPNCTDRTGQGIRSRSFPAVDRGERFRAVLRHGSAVLVSAGVARMRRPVHSAGVAAKHGDWPNDVARHGGCRVFSLSPSPPPSGGRRAPA